MVKLELNEETIRSVVSEVILASIGDEQRQNLIKAAIVHLMTPPERSIHDRGPRSSPIQDAFNHAVENMARRLAFEMLEKDESFHTKIRELISEGLEKVMTTNREATVQRISSALADAFVSR
jgi:hypothetical protein